jgi:catechol 2,3-dioxygenase-like lactoylglutathione lyase family enzyme
MIKNIRHTGIVAKDLGASLHFYRNLLGFKIRRQREELGTYIDNISGLQRVRLTTIKMAAPDGQLIELLYYHTPISERFPRHLQDVGVSHIAFTVEDLGSAYESLKSQGVPFIAPPQTSPDGYAKVTFCMAPEGTYIELVEVL